MRRRWSGTVVLFAVAFAMTGWAPPAAGQGVAPHTTPDGQPDLQGVWNFSTITPLERPEELADKAFLTAEEAAELEQQTAAGRVDAPPPPGCPGGYNQFWFDPGTEVVSDRRTSLVVDPPDGRLPALQPGVPQGAMLPDDGSVVAPPEARPVRFRAGGVGMDGPEDRGLAERCLLGFNTGPPMLPSGFYNDYMQLFQGPDHVVILNEMVHDARIVPLDSRPHLPDGVRQWMGSSRGHWEGNTLVVITTNFTDRTSAFNTSVISGVGTGETLHLVERCTRVDADTLLYEFTVDDPATYTRPFTVAVPMTRSDAPVFEYACHEGNYGLLNILRGARAEEREAAAETGQQ